MQYNIQKNMMLGKQRTTEKRNDAPLFHNFFKISSQVQTEVHVVVNALLLILTDVILLRVEWRIETVNLDTEKLRVSIGLH